MRGSPWLDSKQLEKTSDTVESKNNNNNQYPENCGKDKKEKKVTFKLEECSNTEKSNKESDNIIVVDNVKDSYSLKSSKSIRDKLKVHSEFESSEFAYSLPKGGIAIHLGSSSQVDKVLEEWPGNIFSEGEIPHRPKGTTPTTVGFIRNINTRIRNCDVEDFLRNQKCDIVKVSRLYHRHSGKPMPMRKVIFANRKSLIVAIESSIPFKVNGKQAYCEEERRHKVVRCYNCHRFNHIASNCTFESRCENCNSESHIFSGKCEGKSCCANCGGPHSSSSSNCPKYKQILQKLRLQNIM